MNDLANNIAWFVYNNIVYFNILAIFIFAVFVFGVISWFFNTRLYRHVEYEYNELLVLFNIIVAVLYGVGTIVVFGVSSAPGGLTVMYVISFFIIALFLVIAVIVWLFMTLTKVRDRIIDNQHRGRYD